MLVFAAIAGVPLDLVGRSCDAILGGLHEMPDPTNPTRLSASCSVPGRGVAYPPPRLVRTACELERAGAGITVQSICQENFGPALAGVIEKIAIVLTAGCLPRPLNPDASGMVSCDVVELIPPAMRCDEIPGRVSDGIDGDTGRERCRVVQRIVRDVDDSGDVSAEEAPEPGWYYDTFTEDVALCPGGPQRISFTPGAPPTNGADVRLECTQHAGSGADVAFLEVGTPCVPETAGVCTATGELVDGRSCRRPLACDPVTREYATPCASDADCTAADLAGFRCDGATAFCANPTC
jgi:hypothetical protein